jgi:hypothetical protein
MAFSTHVQHFGAAMTTTNTDRMIGAARRVLPLPQWRQDM